VFLALSIICFLFVIAASARASLLAIFFSFLIWLIKYIKNMNQTRLMYLITFSLFPIIIIFIKLDFITTFLIDILEINSESRGVSSGGTGRVSLWSQGVEIIFSDVFRFFFGGGLRSAGVDDIGLSLESSYLNLIFESGIIITVGFVVFFCLIVHKFTKLSDFNIENGTGLYYSIAMVLTFVFIQSIFNRYLISIGNFYSMFVFIMMFKASHIRKCRILIKF
jgi:exopolysaccharide production protein ExoQ